LFFRLRRSRSPGGFPGCSTTIVHSSGEHYVVAGIEERLSLNLHRPAYTPAEASYPFLKSMPGGEEPPAIDFAVKARAARN